jgi:two-component system NarL family sensor kinase
VHLSPPVEALLYRAAQEAVRNVVAHADAQHVELSLRADDGHAVLRIHDNGTGFDPTTQPHGHFGLRLVRELTAEAGGNLKLSSSPGEGTTIQLEVPAA